MWGLPRYKCTMDIVAEVGDILRPNAESLVIPANTYGVLTDKIAKKVLVQAGDGLANETKAFAQTYKNSIEIGSCFSTQSHKMRRRGLKRIFHAVTTNYPGGIATLDAVNKSVRAAFIQITEQGWKSVTIAALGTGSGRLDPQSVAGIIVPIAKEYCGSVKVRILDENKEFIDAVNALLKKD